MTREFAGAGFYRISPDGRQRHVFWCCDLPGGLIGCWRSEQSARDERKAVLKLTPEQFAHDCLGRIETLAAG